jgi:hypothetical protein
MKEKYVEEPIKEVAEKEIKYLVPPEFDFQTKVEGSLNKKVEINR